MKITKLTASQEAQIEAILKRAWAEVDQAAAAVDKADNRKGFNKEAIEAERQAAYTTWRRAVKNWRAAQDLKRAA